jgi:hypothetical protein
MLVMDHVKRSRQRSVDFLRKQQVKSEIMRYMNSYQWEAMFLLVDRFRHKGWLITHVDFDWKDFDWKASPRLLTVNQSRVNCLPAWRAIVIGTKSTTTLPDDNQDRVASRLYKEIEDTVAMYELESSNIELECHSPLKADVWRVEFNVRYGEQ